jgi:hypothetical protein
VFVALGIQDAMRIRSIVICGLSGSTIFFSHYLKRRDFPEEVSEHKTHVLIFSATFV